MSLNAEDGGKRKFIMVQLPEVCDEKSEAYKAGYKNICEIGKERIRRAGKKIVEETGKTDLDIGFKVLKLDSSNMKDIYYTPDELSQNDLIESISNIKDGRSGYDLLYQCLLDWGLELSLPHKTIKINNNEVHIVNDGDLIACFDANVSEDTIKQIADKKPMRVVFRDSSFATPAARINVDEIFKLKSPQTDIKVL
jgi:adenine-specific DNA-methyltransferase